MIRPRLRLYVCASAIVVTLGGAVLTQAAGPGAFISRLWKRDPAPKKEMTSGFSPFKWLRRDKSNSSISHVEISDSGRRVISERPQLVIDPFLNEQAPTAPRVSQAKKPVSKDVIDRQQSRKNNATNHTVDLSRPVASQRPYRPSDGVERTRVTDFAQDTSEQRISREAKQTLPDFPTAPAPQSRNMKPPENHKFVSGFDREFQKLFKEVIEETRQSKGSVATPRLPDEATTDAASTGTARLPETATSQTDALRKDFADFAQQRSGAEVDKLIRESRNQINSSVLARQAARDWGTTNVAGTSYTDPNAAAPKLEATVDSDVSGSVSMPHRLPDQVPQSVNQLIVPSSMVPERQIFTTSDGRMNRGELGRQAFAETAPNLQPVVRVVPEDRGTGVVIESGQGTLIQPRVSSNVAPARSVPDTSQFRRLSFEGADTSAETGAVQAIGDSIQHPATRSTIRSHAGHNTDHSVFMIPAVSDEAPTVPPELTVVNQSGEEIAMIIPDSRPGQSFAAAEVGAAQASAPAQRPTSQLAFEWPDELEIADKPSSGGYPWKTTACFLALTGGAIGLFFRRKAQGSAFITTGTGTETEIS
jgi:hypothetical protein